MSIERLASLVVGLVLLLPCAFLAAEEEPEWIAPPLIAGSTALDAEGMIRLAGEFPELVIVDSRVGTNRNRGYIEGSVPLADAETHCDSLAGLLAGKETPVAFYCNGPRCQRSSVAVKIALSCGYRRVYWFRGGIQEWEEKDYPLRRD